MQKTWFVTGASHGFGAEIAKPAVRSEDRVVATARKRTALVDGLGPDSGQLMSVELDVTDAAQARNASRRHYRDLAGSTFWSIMPATVIWVSSKK